MEVRVKCLASQFASFCRALRVHHLTICSPFLALHNVFFHPGPGSNVSLYTQRNPYWHLATTRPRTCVRYRNSLSCSAALPRDRSSSACVRVEISKLSRSRFVKSVIRKEQRKKEARSSCRRVADIQTGHVKGRCHFVPDLIWIWNPFWDVDLASAVFK